jgi:hypothetical protein
MDPTSTRLRQWADRKKAGTEHLASLQRRIATDAARCHAAANEDEPVVVPFWSKLAYAGLGAAVTAVVFLAGLQHLAKQPATLADDTIHLGSITPRQLENSRKFFTEMERLFPLELRWVAQSDGQVALGVESVPDTPVSDSKPVAVRVLVLSRKAGDTAWRQAWNADLIVRGQDRVEVVPDRLADNKLTLWIYPLEDGKLAVDTQVDLHLPVTLATRLDTVVIPGQPWEVASMTIDGTEYRVLQTVENI